MKEQKITMTTETYSRTDSGKSWKSKPDEVKKEKVTKQQHKNCTAEDTQKFFRRLGGSESVTRSYTSQGYLVTRLVSCNPDRSIKKVRTWDFN